LIPTNILSIYSYSPFIIALANLIIGSMTNAQKALFIYLPSSSDEDFYHFFVFALK